MANVRAILYCAARIMGDVNAVRRGRIGKRIVRRIVGRAVGKGLRRLIK